MYLKKPHHHLVGFVTGMLIWFNIRKLTRVIYLIHGLKEAEKVSDGIQHQVKLGKNLVTKKEKKGIP